MQTRTRQFVLLFGIVLYFGNGGLLRAGMISRMESLQPGSPTTFPLEVGATTLAHCGDRANQSLPGSEFEASPLPLIRNQSPASDASLLHRSASATERILPRAVEANGLHGDAGSVPNAPQPAAPLGGGKAGQTATAPTSVSREQQAAMPACSVGPEQELISTMAFRFSQSIPAPISNGLFRPPRGR